MIWRPPLSANAITVLVTVGLVLIAASLWWSRGQLRPASRAGLVTLALRGLALALLLFFVLQPARLPEPRKITAKRTLAVLIDTSGSMSQRGTGGTAGPPEAPSRLDEVRQLLADSRLLERAGERAGVALYTFDSQPAPLRPDALAKLAAGGRSTDLGATLEATVKLHQSDDLAGVLIFTDGRNTAGGDPREAAGRLKTPVFAVPVGSAVKPGEAPRQARDLAVEAVSADPRVVLGRSAQVAVSVSATGYDARQVTVELRRNDRVVSTTAVAVGPQQPRRQALFSVKPDAVGAHVYEVRIPGEEGEGNAANNGSTFTVEVVDPVNRLVYLDRLRSERRFLKPVLESRKSLRYTAVVQQDATRVLVDGNDPAMKREAANLGAEQLLGIKAVVLGDLPAAALTEEQVAQLKSWVDKGGALMLLAGPTSMGAEGFATTSLAEVLPVSLGPPPGYLEGEFRVDLTPEGAAHPAFQRVKARWAAAPPLLSRFAVGGVKPAATVLLATADELHAPVVVSQTYGHGKVAVVLSDSTWRWQLGFDPAAPGASDDGSPHAVFWRQMIDWLMPDPGERDPSGGGGGEVQVIADRTEYEVNDEVVLLASVRRGDGSVVGDAKVSFTIAAPPPDGRAIEREGKFQTSGGSGGAASGSDGAYLASFEAYHAGRYDVRVIAKSSTGETLGSDQIQVRAVQPVIEFAQTDPDRALLADLAKLTGGDVLDADKLARIVDVARLQPREVLVQPNSEKDARSAWDRWWLLAAFVALVSGEWLVRRRNQWV